MTQDFPALRRRTLLAATAALAGTSLWPLPARSVRTRARIVIIGAGAAGLTVANRLARRLEGAEITLVDKTEEHHYQAGYTLIAAGTRDPDYVVSRTSDHLLRSVKWVAEHAAEIDPVAKRVVTTSGRGLGYDFLVVAPGVELNFAAIEGMDRSLIGRNGIAAIYAGPHEAQASFRAMVEFVERGGVGLFGRPPGEIKCGGAPIKFTYVAEDAARRRGNRSKVEIVHNAAGRAIVGVPIVQERLRMLCEERGIKVNYNHVLRKIDPARRIATYQTPDGTKELRYDFIDVVPPMRAPAVLRESPLKWQTGPWANDGYVEVDRFTLRHARFPEVFALGDAAGIPKAKTGASVRKQAPVVVENLIAAMEGREPTARYTGYTSCPFVTAAGTVMMVEFDYNDNLTPSFPGIITPLDELWASWNMKYLLIKPMYYAMLRGLA